MEAKLIFKYSVKVVKHRSSLCHLLDPRLLPTCSGTITLTMATMVPTQANIGGGKEPSREIVTGPELHSTENPC